MRAIALTALLGASLALATQARASEQDGRGGDPWTSFLPVAKSLVGKRAVELPLPFGVSFDFLYESQKLRIARLKSVTIDGVAVPRQLLDDVALSDITADSFAYEGRIDAWVLPFLDLYAVGGHETGTARLRVTFPGILSDQPIKDDYDVWTYGGGGTVAAGYQQLFATFDANYTISSVSLLKSDVGTLVLGPRVGLREHLLGGSEALWAGAMFQSITADQFGTTSFGPLENIDFDVDVEVVDPWNALLGAEIDLGPHLQLTVEGGLGTRRSILFSLTGRL